jgi:hypothetical protein
MRIAAPYLDGGIAGVAEKDRLNPFYKSIVDAAKLYRRNVGRPSDRAGVFTVPEV